MQDPLYTVKKGDFVVYKENGEVIARDEILGRVDDLVFTRRVNPDGSVGSPTGPQLLEDLATYGVTKEEKEEEKNDD